MRTDRYYRLPTEAEWEYAARAGTESSYFFGDDPKDLGRYAWFGGALEEGSRRSGMKQPNPWGLYDMYGNVAEWTLDGWSDEYRGRGDRLVQDPWVPRAKGEAFGVARGGDWTSKPHELRSAARRQAWDIDPTTGEFLPDWWDGSDEGVRVGMRLVAPARWDGEAARAPPRATHIEPFGVEQGSLSPKRSRGGR